MAVVASALLTAACSVLPSPKAGPTHTYRLQQPASAGPVPASPGTAVLAVAVPEAGAGLDTARMAYVKQPFGIRYFARSRWADTPAHMLAPLMVSALAASGRFGAVLPAPASVPAALELDTRLLRFDQDFTHTPSRVTIALSARVTDRVHQRILATRVFQVSEPAPGDDPYAGVQAANRAVDRLLKQLTAFCVAQLPPHPPTAQGEAGRRQ